MSRARSSGRRGGVLRWGTTVIAVALLLAYMVTSQWELMLDRRWTYTTATGSGTGGKSVVGYSGGAVALFVLDDPRPLPPPGVTRYWWEWRVHNYGWGGAQLIPYVSFKNGFAIEVPVWIPAILVGAWAGLLWRKHLMKAAGKCACGYSREGLAAGAACPECGAVPGPV